MNENNSKVWGIVGKVSSVLVVLWTLIQIYNGVVKSQFSAIITGDHNNISYPPSLIQDKNKLFNYEYFLYNFSFKATNVTSNRQFDSLLNASNEQNKKEIDKKLFFLYSDKFNPHTMWTFSIKNDGNNPLEELSLELPFSGEYRLASPDSGEIIGTFSNRIKLGTLNPSLTYYLTIWTDESSNYSGYNEENCRVNHKFGTFDISFPYKTGGIIAKIFKLDFFLIFISILVVILIYILIYAEKMRKLSRKKINLIIEKNELENNTEKDMD